MNLFLHSAIPAHDPDPKQLSARIPNKLAFLATPYDVLPTVPAQCVP